MASNNAVEVVNKLLETFLPEHDLALYNTEFVKEGKEWYLRVYIEKPAPQDGEEERYIDIGECQLVSDYLSDRLDELDPIEQNYTLEVSSPGMDRALIKDEDYVRFSGHMVDVTLSTAFENRKAFSEVELKELRDGKLIITETPVIQGKKGTKPKFGDPVTYEIPFEQVKQVKLSVIF